MKIKMFFGLITFIILSCGSTKSEAELAMENQAFNKMKSLVMTNNFRFNAEVAFPFLTNDVVMVTNALMRQTENANGRFSLSANDDFIVVKSDSVKADLSYFGELRSVGYSDSRDSAIQFNNSVEDYKISENEKKKTLLITYKVRNETERFNVKILAFYNGNANVVIYSSNRTTIRYDGKLTSIESL